MAASVVVYSPAHFNRQRTVQCVLIARRLVLDRQLECLWHMQTHAPIDRCNHRSFDDILQFANITRPVVALHPFNVGQ